MSDERGAGPHFETPSIEKGVRGPANKDGILLRAPRSDELLWDLEAEIGSARRVWFEDRQAWWIDSGYLQTVVMVVLRSFPSVLIFDQEEDLLLSRDGLAARQGRLL